ncbi:MAG: hypothetical protein HY686_08720, partial [Chloroflexi bacterium]|nr:hypothetical protein [Chloroflexota bacterium]
MKYPAPGDAIARLWRPEHGKVAELLGLRSYESRPRMYGLISSGSYIARGPAPHVDKVRPIYDWREDGFTLDATLKWGSYSTPRDWLLGLWTVPLLLTNPFIDGTFWHRARYADPMRPYWWGFAMFFSCLCLVAALGLLRLQLHHGQLGIGA